MGTIVGQDEDLQEDKGLGEKTKPRYAFKKLIDFIF